MTPDELDAAEDRAAAVDAEYDRGGGGGWGTVHESQSDVPVLIAALREAWAEAALLKAALDRGEDEKDELLTRIARLTRIAAGHRARANVAEARAVDAEAECAAMRRGEVDGIFTSVVHGCCERVEKAGAAIARVRALCDEYPDTPEARALARRIRAVLDGEA